MNFVGRHHLQKHDAVDTTIFGDKNFTGGFGIKILVEHGTPVVRHQEFTFAQQFFLGTDAKRSDQRSEGQVGPAWKPARIFGDFLKVSNHPVTLYPTTGERRVPR